MKNSYILDTNRRKVYPFYPKLEDLDIEVISTSLSNKCRFNGLCSNFYSIAEHCVIMSEYMNSDKESLTALLHEIGEVFLADIAGPLKPFLFYKDFKNNNDRLISHNEIEDEYLYLCNKKFDIIYPLPESVKIMDKVMLNTELRQFFNFQWEETNNYSFLDRHIECWDPQYAKHKFLKRFKDLV